MTATFFCGSVRLRWRSPTLWECTLLKVTFFCGSVPLRWRSPTFVGVYPYDEGHLNVCGKFALVQTWYPHVFIFLCFSPQSSSRESRQYSGILFVSLSERKFSAPCCTTAVAVQVYDTLIDFFWIEDSSNEWSGLFVCSTTILGLPRFDGNFYFLFFPKNHALGCYRNDNVCVCLSVSVSVAVSVCMCV